MYKYDIPHNEEELMREDETTQEAVRVYERFRDTLDKRSYMRRKRGESLLRFNPYEGQGRILTQLGTEESLTQAELAARLDIKPQTLSTAIKKLEHAGLVTRRPDENDGRALRVGLTNAGLDAKRSLDERAKYSGSMFDALSPEERIEICRLLGKLTKHLEHEIVSIGVVEGHGLKA